MGENVKYNGGHNAISHPWLKRLAEEGALLSLCPEVLGGMSIPRIPSEILQDTTTIINQNGEDVSHFFTLGAQKTLQYVHEEGIVMAILKARSPSCGKGFIYDGTFSRSMVVGFGITCKLLQDNGVRVFSEEELEEAWEFWTHLS